MSKTLGLDPKKFKHVSSDDKKTVLQHKDGHTLTIAHNVLSPKMKAQLDALSKMAKENQTSSQAQEAQEQDPKKYYASGGPVIKPQNIERPDAGFGAIKIKAQASEEPNQREMMAEGGQPQAPEALRPDYGITQVPTEFVPEDPDKQAFRQAHDQFLQPPNFRNPVVGGIQMMMQGLNPEERELRATESGLNAVKLRHEDEEAKKAQEIALQARKAKINTQLDQAGLPPLPGSQPNAGGMQAMPASNQEPPPTTPDQQRKLADNTPEPQGMQGGDMGMDDTQNMLMSGYNQRMQGINQAAKAEGQLGQQQAQVLQQDLQNKENAKQSYINSYNELEQERQNHIQDIKDGYIDPNKYWDNHSKIATGIGMILAGFNPTNSPNAAVNFLKYQMDQNIAAQAKNLETKNNLLSANLRQFGNLRDAQDMTRIMQQDIVANQLATAAANAKTPQAQAAALQASGQLKMETAPLMQQFAMRRAMMNMANGGADSGSIDHMIQYMRVMNPQMAKEMEGRYVPGVGLGSVPIPEAVRSELVSHKKLDDAAKDLLTFVKGHRTLNPLSSDYKIGAQKALVVQQMIREGMLGTVFRESEKPLLNKMLDENPAGVMKMISTEPKLRTLLESNEAQLNALKGSYGLPVQQQVPEAIREPQAAAQTRMINGVQYQKVQGGWKRVK